MSAAQTAIQKKPRKKKILHDKSSQSASDNASMRNIAVGLCGLLALPIGADIGFAVSVLAGWTVAGIGVSMIRYGISVDKRNQRRVANLRKEPIQKWAAKKLWFLPPPVLGMVLGVTVANYCRAEHRKDLENIASIDKSVSPIVGNLEFAQGETIVKTGVRLRSMGEESEMVRMSPRITAVMCKAGNNLMFVGETSPENQSELIQGAVKEIAAIIATSRKECLHDIRRNAVPFYGD